VDQDRQTRSLSYGAAATNLTELVTRHAARATDTTALVQPEQPEQPRRSLSWAELNAAVDSVAAGLAAHGLVAGHRVGLMGPSSIEFVVAYLAALRAGFVTVPLDPDSTDDELRAVLADTGVRLLLSADSRGVSVTTIPLTQVGLAALGAEARGPVTSPQDREALAVLLFTAGTSGEPKAAMLTHRALLSQLEHVDGLRVVGPDTVSVSALPLFHVFGLNAVVGSWVMGGGTLVLTDGSVDQALDAIAAEQVTHLTLVPVQLYRMLNSDRMNAGALASVRTVVSGAAPLPVALSRELTQRTGLRVDQGYGLTEAAPGVSATLGGALLGPGTGRMTPNRPRSRFEARTSSPATGQTVGTVRTPMAGSPPGTSATCGTGSSSWWTVRGT